MFVMQRYAVMFEVGLIATLLSAALLAWQFVA
jgi:Flp pilus assembly pilin Flp